MSAASDAEESDHKCECECGDEGACMCKASYVEKAGYGNVAETDALRAAREGTKKLFKDEEFLVETPTLTGDVPACVVWKRPHELCEDPQVFVDGASRLDVLQGQNLGDCWLIAACSALADHPDLIRELIPNGIELKPGGPENNYTGKVTIYLWGCGVRFPMVIDDRLPVMNTNVGLKLVYGTCKETSEFWLPLVEKAVAKYQGGYKNLRGRQIAEGLIMLTGYSVNRIELVNYNPIDDLYEFLKNELDRKSLIIAAGKTNELVRISRRVFVGSDCEESAKKSEYHTYTVNKVLKLSDGTQLFRIRNPWGTEADCTGKFRISEDLLKGLPAATVEELLLCPCSDGEYWVDENGFYEKFEEMCVANKNPSVSIDKLVPSKDVACARGEWKDKTIGGPPNPDSFDNNCQFLFQVDIEDHEAVQEKYPILLELIQDLHRIRSIPFASGMLILKLKPEHAAWQAVGAANPQRYLWEQLKKGALVQLPCESGSGQACVVRDFYGVTPGIPYVVAAWVELEAKKAESPVGFLLRVFSPAGVVVRLSKLPDPS